MDEPTPPSIMQVFEDPTNDKPRVVLSCHGCIHACIAGSWMFILFLGKAEEGCWFERNHVI